ncbi:hypothetical protein HNR46_000164 [Haloferula luteola]|uniref:PEP-CTERM protein-sorting domain-containing protein n=1 Tax=Haloferula luteola TaxID=595692 RepID=A0A840UY92_9BACT|nr:PEP-CTERM sorting domain-containing protein [Haloferula luteola]MBB5349943.1 hypothetical protein [Haloferula luteola]
MHHSLTSRNLGRRAGLAALLVTLTTAHGATITFTSAASFDTADVLDAPYTAGYQFVAAMNIGDNAKTFDTPGGNSITFATGYGVADLGDLDMPEPESTTTGYYNGNPQWGTVLFAGGTGSIDFDDILRGNAWHTNGSDSAQPLTLRLTDLTIGTTYAVYLYSVDQRSSSADRSQAYWDSFSGGTFSGGTSGLVDQTSPQVVMGTFVADASYQDIFIQEADGIDNDDTHLSAFTLYTVPEPTTSLLVAGSLSLLGIRRRRAR